MGKLFTREREKRKLENISEFRFKEQLELLKRASPTAKQNTPVERQGTK